MKCAKCHSENSDTSRFCSNCGTQLAAVCPRCNHANSASARFCVACGTALAQPAAAEPQAASERSPGAASWGERRQVTVMCTDVSGYTAMTERLDPEEVNEVLNRVKQTAAQVVGRHGGTINQFIGDEAIALFGIPNAEEDDAVRAVRAALELHGAIRDTMSEYETRVGERLTIHTGINTGLIFAQYRNDREGLYQLTGDTVNTAARLRALASADEVLIGPGTYRLAMPYFELETLSPVTVKGKAAPLVPHRVVAESRIRSRFEAAQERGFTGHVNRVRELATLRACVDRAVAGEGQLVTVAGEPGIGKSRLLYEFLSGLDREQFSVPQGRCQSHGTEIPYFPFIDSLRHGLHLTEHDTRAETAKKAVASIRQIDPTLEKHLPFLLHLLAVPSEFPLPPELHGEALRHAMEEALVAMMTRVAKHQPMVLVLEDWHWSDPASQSALRYLLRQMPTHRLMIVVSHRSTYTFDFGQGGVRTELRLNPLNEEEAGDLIRSVTGTVELPVGLSAMICQSADGNPLFVEEACYSLLESGAISVRDRDLVLHQSLDRMLLPDTVQAVIRARLDRLDDGAREVVGTASVIGREFSRPILERIYTGAAPLKETLALLEAQEIVRQAKHDSPEPEYTFRHVLTREVAYDALLHQRRKQLHAAVGEAIESLYPERLAENAPILAYHFARSPRADKAVQYALSAGERAARLYANAEATTYFDDALSLAKSLPPSPEAQRAQIDAILGQVAVGTAPRDMERDRTNLTHAAALAEALSDRRRLAQSLYWLGRNRYVLAELGPAIEFARRSLEIADEIGDPALSALPVNLMGRAYWQQSDFVRSARMMERNVEQMKMLGNQSEESTAAGFVSALFGYMGEFEKALDYSDRSIALARTLQNPYAEAANLHYRGIIRDQQGDWRGAIADYAIAQRIAEGAGDMFRVYLVKFMEGRARQMIGELASGRALIEEALTLATKIGTTFIIGQARSALASCRLASGEIDGTLALCTESVDVARKAGDKFTEAIALRMLGEMLARTDGPEQRAAGRQALADAIGLQQQIGALPELARSHASMAAIAAAEGAAGEAQRHRKEALDLFERLGMPWDLASVRGTVAPAARAG